MRRSVVGELALLVLALVLVPACGDGGSDGGSSAFGGPPAALPGTTVQVHTSTVTPMQVLLASGNFVRQITFIPVDPTDEILYVTAEGSAIGNLNFTLELRDPGARVITSWQFGQSAAVEYGYQLVARPSSRSSWVATFASYPAASYTLYFVVINNSTTSQANLMSLKFRIVTAEGVTVASPSPQISG